MRTNQSLRPLQQGFGTQLFHFAAPREVANGGANIAQNLENEHNCVAAKWKISRVRRVEAGRVQAAIAVIFS